MTGYQINFEAGPSSENDQIRTLAGTITVDAGSSLTVAAGGGASGDATLEQPYEGNVLNNQNPDTVALLAPDGTTIATTGEQTPQQGQDQDPQQDQEQQDQPQEQAPTDVSATFADQTSDGTMVTIESATLPDGGFVAIHDSSLQDGQVLDSVIGVSDALNAGTHQNIEIQLFEGVPTQMFSQDALNEDQTLIAMPHFDTDSDGRYDFVCRWGERWPLHSRR